LNQFLYAEYAPLKRYVSKLEKQKAEQTPESLANLWGTAETADAVAKGRELVEIGFFLEKGRNGRADILGTLLVSGRPSFGSRQS
jgi:hypothetical protein